MSNVLYRSFKDPIDGRLLVIVVLESLRSAVVIVAHHNTGHANWETMWRALSCHCFFPGMAEMCQIAVRQCRQCRTANPSKEFAGGCGVRIIVPIRPRDIVQVDTLKLGSSGTQFHCVLVCIDMFSKSVEVIPLLRHDGASVAEAFLKICLRFGASRVVHSDNCT